MKKIQPILIGLALFLGILALGLILSKPQVNQTEQKAGSRTADSGVEISSGNLNASTTPIAVLNPNNASSSVVSLLIDQTGVSTSTGVWTCGTSTSPYGTPSASLLDGVSVATDTPAVLENGLFNSPFPAGTLSQQKIFWKPNEYIVCSISSVYPTAFTNATSKFGGTFKIKSNK